MAYKYFSSTKNPHYRRLVRESKKKRGGRRPTYRKRRPTYRRKGAMSKKRILNITTVKKRDNMPSYTNMGASGTGTVYSVAPAIIQSNTSSEVNQNHPVVLIWNATARDLSNFAGTNNARVIESARTSSTPYMVGLREVVEIQNLTGVPWQWRRICFTYKGTLPGTAQTTAFRTYQETNAGFMRVVNNVTGDRNGGPAFDFYALLFAGQNASDWQDPMVAKTDRTRVTIKYDKTRNLTCGNEQGFIRKYKHWHAMGKTLAYDDDENGENMLTNYTSVDSKVGMGDYYVVDFLRSRFGATTSQTLTFNPSATLYWHEK